MNLKESTKNACEEIDASIFTGDEFVSSASRRAEMVEYLERWARALHEFDVAHTFSMLEEFATTGSMPDPN